MNSIIVWAGISGACGIFSVILSCISIERDGGNKRNGIQLLIGLFCIGVALIIIPLSI